MYSIGDKVECEHQNNWYETTITYVGIWGAFVNMKVEIEIPLPGYYPFHKLKKKSSILNLELDPYGEEYW